MQSWAKIGTAVPRDFGTAPRPVPTGFFGTGGTFFLSEDHDLYIFGLVESRRIFGTKFFLSVIKSTKKYFFLRPVPTSFVVRVVLFLVVGL